MSVSTVRHVVSQVDEEVNRATPDAAKKVRLQDIVLPLRVTSSSVASPVAAAMTVQYLTLR